MNSRDVRSGSGPRMDSPPATNANADYQGRTVSTMRKFTHGTGGSMSKAASTANMTSRAPKRDIAEVWADYKKNKTEALRNTLMENYLHLVRYNAERIHVKLPDEVELD